MQKLKAVSIIKFLLRAGLLFEETGPAGGRSRRPTRAGWELGISTAQRSGPNGDYSIVVYSREAQQFILDNLDAIIAINAAPLHENEGKPWTPDEDAYLRRTAQTGTEVRDQSEALGRPRSEIRARRKALGLPEN